jgi:gliding motility-associated-like protein
MKNLKASIFFILLMRLSMANACDVINGSDIIFRHLGGYKYHVKFVLYHQCVCKLGIMPKFTMSCGNTIVSIVPPRTKIRDITPVCSNGQPPCTNGGYSGTRYGIEEHTFEDTIDFANSPYNTFLNNNCCEIKFRVAQPWGLVGTTTTTTTYGGEAMMNICAIKTKGNNTPTLSTIPMSFMCCNQPFTFNNGVFDNLDNDSLAFSLDEPLSATFNPVSWNSPLNKDIPLTPYCPPNPGTVNCRALPNAKPPRGFYFDKETGDMVFTPTKCDESGPVAIRVSEFRKDSITKKMVQIGYTRRDIYVTVVTCSDNNPPYIEGLNKYNVCEGKKICFTIKAKDDPYLPKQTVPDTVNLTWNYGIPDATFTIIDPTAREKEAQFCWTPKVGDARNQAYSFAATAKDDACPRPAYAIKGFNIKVNPKARSKRQYEILDCGKFRFTSWAGDTVNYNQKNYLYKFTIRDSSNSGAPVYTGYVKRDSIKFKRGGKYIIEHEINNPPFNCITIYSDTVIIPPVLSVDLAFGKDTFVCAGDNITLEPKIENGIPSYKYLWESPYGTINPKDTFSKFTLVKPTATTKVVLKLTDAKKCVDRDTILVKYQPNPVVEIGPDQRICTYDMTILSAQNADTMRYFWLPNGDSTQSIVVNTANRYIAKVIDKLGCHTSDTMHLFVNDTVVAIAKPNLEICINDTLKIKARRRPLGHTRTMAWRDLNTGITISNDSSFAQKISTMVPKRYELDLKVTQGGIMCQDKDTLEVQVNALPTFVFAGLPPRCYSDGAINLSQAKIAKASSGDKTQSTFDVRYYQTKKPSWITGGPVGVNVFTYNYPNFIKNYQVPKVGLRDTICYDFRDYKGCYNKDCKPTKLNPNPDVFVKDSTYCQRVGQITLDKQVVRPFSKIGGIESFRVIEVPQGSNIDPAAIISTNTSNTPPTTEMDPGKEGENEKTGKYVIEYCFKDAITGCQTCDTANVFVIRLPEIQFTEFNKQCINYPLMALDSFVIDKNTGNRFPYGTWETIEYAGSRDLSNPNIAPKILNSVKSKKYFDPKNGAGQYLVKLTDVSSGCPVTDSTEILVNGLPIIQINVPDTVCSSAAPFVLNNILPVGNVGTWSGKGVSLRQFNPSISSKTKLYEGPISIKFEYSNPLTTCTSSDSQTLLIQSQAEVIIGTKKPYQQCEGIDFNLSATKNWANSITWSHNGDGLYSDPKNLITTYKHGLKDTGINDLAGKVLLTIKTDKLGVCPQAKDEINLIIEPYPQFDFTADPVLQCEPAVVNFLSLVNKPVGSSNLTYTWDFGNGQTLNQSLNAAPLSIRYDTANRNWYDVTLRIDNKWGAGVNETCPITKDSLDFIKVLPQPKAGFSSDPGYYTTVAFPKFKFFNETKTRWISPATIDYNWHFGSSDPDDTSTAKNPIHNYPADTMKYRVVLTSTISYSGLTCTDSLGQVREIDPDVTVFVPTAFSPEGTGPKDNNMFKAVVNGEKSFHIQILNRWGEKLWETTDKNAAWDGKSRGEDVQQDVYMWVIKVAAFDGEEYTYEGTVTLLR